MRDRNSTFNFLLNFLERLEPLSILDLKTDLLRRKSTYHDMFVSAIRFEVICLCSLFVVNKPMKSKRENGAAPAAELGRCGSAGLRRRMNNELNFPPNFERLVLGCIDADFCK